MQISKSILATIFLMVFAAAQLTALHEFSHDDQGSDCEICLIAHDFQQTDFALTEAISFEIVEINPVSKLMIVETAFAKADSHTSLFFTRPPPALL
ncbi:hypothetical protein [Nonlabens xiamenensis]|uniref:hypothetical protein n=1 Tax=Nonlabens xiamenensis TaxID=2341043 RepID=UPI000F60EE75|nr:hypothetical protein [Nonlabens xiamenensis]